MRDPRGDDDRSTRERGGFGNVLERRIMEIGTTASDRCRRRWFKANANYLFFFQKFICSVGGYTAPINMRICNT